MKRLILLTALFALCLTGYALANPNDNDEGSPTSESAQVTVDVPAIFWLEWAEGEDGDYDFVLTEANVINGGTLESGEVGTLEFRSNYNGTDLDVQRTAWGGGGDGDFGLGIYTGSGYTAIPVGSDQNLGSWLNGVDSFFDVYYQLSGFGLEDDPGIYTTTVTYTLSHS